MTVRIRWPFPSPLPRRCSPALRAGLVTLVAAGLLGTAGCKEYGVVAAEGTVSTSAGTITVQCIDRMKVRVAGTSPAAGYTANVLVPGPAGQATVEFTNPDANDFRVAVYCQGGVPSFQEFEREDTTLTD
ncbi:MAG: hypothetical protein IRY85_09680 [Micromonosporaceae bacterium]|nr:hypothetical protein [Micromonosporaceae bacterium]